MVRRPWGSAAPVQIWRNGQSGRGRCPLLTDRPWVPQAECSRPGERQSQGSVGCSGLQDRPSKTQNGDSDSSKGTLLGGDPQGGPEVPISQPDLLPREVGGHQRPVSGMCQDTAKPRTAHGPLALPLFHVGTSEAVKSSQRRIAKDRRAQAQSFSPVLLSKERALGGPVNPADQCVVVGQVSEPGAGPFGPWDPEKPGLCGVRRGLPLRGGEEHLGLQAC